MFMCVYIYEYLYLDVAYNIMQLYMSNDASVYLEVLLPILPLGVLSVNTNTE